MPRPAMLFTGFSDTTSTSTSNVELLVLVKTCATFKALNDTVKKENLEKAYRMWAVVIDPLSQFANFREGLSPEDLDALAFEHAEKDFTMDQVAKYFERVRVLKQGGKGTPKGDREVRGIARMNSKGLLDSPTGSQQSQPSPSGSAGNTMVEVDVPPPSPSSKAKPRPNPLAALFQG